MKITALNSKCVIIASAAVALGFLAKQFWKKKRGDFKALRPAAKKRPYKLHASSSTDLFLELKLRGVEVDDSSLLVVQPPPGMGDATCAAYAALHYYRFVDLPVDINPALLLPSHPEVDRKGQPYVNTLAVMRLPELTDRVIREMAARVQPLLPTVLVAFETRAMAFGAVLAYYCHCAFVPARKELDTVGVDIVREVVNGTESYRDTCRIAIDGEPFVVGDRVVIVDDVVSSGATIRALRKLIQKCGVDVVGEISLVNFLVPSQGVIEIRQRPPSLPSLPSLPPSPSESHPLSLHRLHTFHAAEQ